MCKLLGRPTSDNWSGFQDVPNSKHLLSLISPDFKHNTLKVKFENLSRNCINLLEGLLSWDPNTRFTVSLLKFKTL